MNLKEELKKLRQRLLGKARVKVSGEAITQTPSEYDFAEIDRRMFGTVEQLRESIITQNKRTSGLYMPIIKDISLVKKVDDFIRWYYENIVSSRSIDVDCYQPPVDLRNFIEKMAVWYELRYPDYEINRLIPYCSQESTDVSDVMFNGNGYVNDFFDKDSDIRAVDWDAFYNPEVFIASLPQNERNLFLDPVYSKIVYIDLSLGVHFHLAKNGIVKGSEGLSMYTSSLVVDDEILGLHVEEVLDLLKEKGICLPSDNEALKAIQIAREQAYQKKELLNCVMYRIIERGGNRLGPRRAFLFAREFGQNIDIPMMYGVDFSDQWLRFFINEYIKAGGSKELMCYVGYFDATDENTQINTVSLQNLIASRQGGCLPRYTTEEIELHQEMVDVLLGLVDQRKVDSEKVKQLRLERKLAKARQRL